MRILRFRTFPHVTFFWGCNPAVGLLLLICFDCLFAGLARAEWKMAVQSRTVPLAQQNVTVSFTYAWDISIIQATLPIIVRETVGYAFWTGSLPYDTVDNDGNRFSHGVTWNPIVEN